MADKKLMCSIKLKDCTGEAKYSCHHCGRPLCDGPNCRKSGWDTAFAGWPIAHHCPNCDHLFLGFKWVRMGLDVFRRSWLGRIIRRKYS